jgi:hypothetical protein
MLAVRVTFPPVQNVVEPLAEIVGVATVFTVTFVADEVAEHPLLCVTFTV